MSVWKGLTALSRSIDRVNRAFGRAMVWPIFAAVVVSAGNAMSRKFLDLSSNAWLELQWYLFALGFLGAAGYVLLVDEHVRVDAVSARLPRRVRVWFDLVLMLAVVLPLTALLGSLGYELFLQAWTSGEMSSNAGGLPRWPAWACIPLGMALLAAQALSEAIRRAAWLAGRTDVPSLKEADLPPFLPEAADRDRADGAAR